MNHWNIILGLGTILGLYFFRKIKPTYLKVIFIGFSISFALPYFEKQEITKKKFADIIVYILIIIAFFVKYITFQMHHKQ